MSKADDLYAFVFKGAIAQDTIIRELNRNPEDEEGIEKKIEAKLPLDILDKDYVISVKKWPLYTQLSQHLRTQHENFFKIVCLRR